MRLLGSGSLLALALAAFAYIALGPGSSDLRGFWKLLKTAVPDVCFYPTPCSAGRSFGLRAEYSV